MLGLGGQRVESFISLASKKYYSLGAIDVLAMQHAIQTCAEMCLSCIFSEASMNVHSSRCLVFLVSCLLGSQE
jgi:hypothetical protein